MSLVELSLPNARVDTGGGDLASGINATSTTTTKNEGHQLIINNFTGNPNKVVIQVLTSDHQTNEGSERSPTPPVYDEGSSAPPVLHSKTLNAHESTRDSASIAEQEERQTSDDATTGAYVIATPAFNLSAGHPTAQTLPTLTTNPPTIFLPRRTPPSGTSAVDLSSLPPNSRSSSTTFITINNASTVMLVTGVPPSSWEASQLPQARTVEDDSDRSPMQRLRSGTNTSTEAIRTAPSSTLREPSPRRPTSPSSIVDPPANASHSLPRIQTRTQSGQFQRRKSKLVIQQQPSPLKEPQIDPELQPSSPSSSTSSQSETSSAPSEPSMVSRLFYCLRGYMPSISSSLESLSSQSISPVRSRSPSVRSGPPSRTTTPYTFMPHPGASYDPPDRARRESS